MRIRAVLLMLLLACGAIAQAEPTSDQIRGWVDNLSSRNYSKRDRATKELVAAGRPAIKPLMEAIAEHGLEVTTRGVYVLQQLAVSGDEATEDAARESLTKIAAPRVTASARHASDALKKLDFLRQKRAISELERLGALIESDPDEPLLNRIGPFYRVEINEDWKGTTADLRWLKYLLDVEQVSFIGPKVTDEWLKHLPEMSNVMVVKIKRAKITAEGLVVLREMERLQIVLLMYMPIGDACINHLALCKRVMRVHLLGTKMTDAGEQKLRNAMAAQIDRRRGAFLGIAASEPNNLMWQIDRVTPGGAAAQAGLQPGDSLVTYDGKPVGDFDTLRSFLAQNDAGDTVTLKLRRKGEVIEREVTLGEWD